MKKITKKLFCMFMSFLFIKQTLFAMETRVVDDTCCGINCMVTNFSAIRVEKVPCCCTHVTIECSCIDRLCFNALPAMDRCATSVGKALISCINCDIRPTTNCCRRVGRNRVEQPRMNSTMERVAFRTFTDEIGSNDAYVPFDIIKTQSK